jgi:hypothetical protein
MMKEGFIMNKPMTLNNSLLSVSFDEPADPDFKLTYNAQDILQDQADSEAGRIKTYSLAEIKDEPNAEESADKEIWDTQEILQAMEDVEVGRAKTKSLAQVEAELGIHD